MNAPVHMMTFHVPDDQQLLAAWARVSITHAQLDYVLRMTVKTLAGLEIHDGLDATAFNSSKLLRERIQKLARNRLGEGPALLRVQAILERARRLTARRNELIHNIVGRNIDGDEPMMQRENYEWGPLPTVAQLNALTAEIGDALNELNFARLEGFLAEALAARA